MIEHTMNEQFNENDELVAFDSENGVCHVEWSGRVYQFWYCTVHDADYYHECALDAEIRPKSTSTDY
jgi:predicted heme/steroid binding protein